MTMKTLQTEGAITNQKLSGERTLMIMIATSLQELPHVLISQQHEPLVLRIIVTTENCNSYALFWISIHMYMNNQKRIFLKWKLAIAYLLLPVAFSIVMYCSCEKNIFRKRSIDTFFSFITASTCMFHIILLSQCL